MIGFSTPFCSASLTEAACACAGTQIRASWGVLPEGLLMLPAGRLGFPATRPFSLSSSAASTSTCCSHPALSHLLAGLPLLISDIPNYLDSASNLCLLKQAWDDNSKLHHPLLSLLKWLIQENSVYFLVLVPIFAFLKLALANIAHP